MIIFVLNLGLKILSYCFNSSFGRSWVKVSPLMSENLLLVCLDTVLVSDSRWCHFLVAFLRNPPWWDLFFVVNLRVWLEVKFSCIFLLMSLLSHLAMRSLTLRRSPSGSLSDKLSLLSLFFSYLSSKSWINSSSDSRLLLVRPKYR